MSITYGLFQKCYSWNNKCVRFPDPKAGDCDADGTKFCDLWQLARIGMVLAAVHGVTIFVYTLATLFSRPLVQRRRWGKTVMGLIIHMGMAGLTLGVVGHLFNSADRFRVGTGLGASYITTLVAVILDTFAALILTTAVLNSPPEYQPIMY
ncbi:hypothetical protein IWQ62_003411 [Dispira parvispora]|uniref:Uncharacterized protein n=1 Tax=Dispira parvispora TaxID=1520584 RepID=A0A9W8AQX7_9FUNG|nr:hypothetical protein IWQ62_003411 [Dispira parvispora]